MLTVVALATIAALVAALVGAAYQRAGEANDARQLPPLGHLVEVGAGRRLHARCSGRGDPAVVLESGIAASSLSWTLVQPRVAEFTRVCSYDRAGLGWSDAAGLARIGFVRFCLDQLANGSTAVPRCASRMFGSEASGVLNHLVGEVQKLPPETWPSVRALWSQPKCFGGMARHLAGLPASAFEANECGALGDIPLVVISAGRQPEASQLDHERTAALSSRGRHIVAADSGHWVHLDQPELVVSAIRNVIKKGKAWT